MSRKKQETKSQPRMRHGIRHRGQGIAAATGTVIGKNSDLGTVYPVVAYHNSPAGLPKGRGSASRHSAVPV